MNKFEHENEWADWVDNTVVKHSGKPFKSGNHIGIAVDMDINPYSGRPAFVMDDGSLVDCYQCKLN